MRQNYDKFHQHVLQLSHPRYIFLSIFNLMVG